MAGYHVQIVVDAKHKLIVAEDVCQDGNDTHLHLCPRGYQLAPMLEKAQGLLPSENLTALADSGYPATAPALPYLLHPCKSYDGNQLKACEDQNLTVYAAIPDKSKAIAAQGRFTRDRFSYDAGQDRYTCPQGKPLTLRGKPLQKNDKWISRYQSKAADCSQCPLREQCLAEKASTRQITRWEHEAVAERHQQRMHQNPNRMKRRGALVEHPFGTLKHRADMHHFLMRGLAKCRREFSLMAMAYNFTRVLNILGVGALRDHCARRSENALKNATYA